MISFFSLLGSSRLLIERTMVDPDTCGSSLTKNIFSMLCHLLPYHVLLIRLFAYLTPSSPIQEYAHCHLIYIPCIKYLTKVFIIYILLSLKDTLKYAHVRQFKSTLAQNFYSCERPQMNRTCSQI